MESSNKMHTNQEWCPEGSQCRETLGAKSKVSMTPTNRASVMVKNQSLRNRPSWRKLAPTGSHKIAVITAIIISSFVGTHASVSKPNDEEPQNKPAKPSKESRIHRRRVKHGQCDLTVYTPEELTAARKRESRRVPVPVPVEKETTCSCFWKCFGPVYESDEAQVFQEHERRLTTIITCLENDDVGTFEKQRIVLNVQLYCIDRNLNTPVVGNELTSTVMGMGDNGVKSAGARYVIRDFLKELLRSCFTGEAHEGTSYYPHEIEAGHYEEEQDKFVAFLEKLEDILDVRTM